MLKNQYGTKLYFIKCDGEKCGIESVTYKLNSIEYLKKRLRRAGWFVSANKDLPGDYCPNCRGEK
jgi:hypothetical protein